MIQMTNLAKSFFQKYLKIKVFVTVPKFHVGAGKKHEINFHWSNNCICSNDR